MLKNILNVEYSIYVGMYMKLIRFTYSFISQCSENWFNTFTSVLRFTYEIKKVTFYMFSSEGYNSAFKSCNRGVRAPQRSTATKARETV